jgi:O-antigen ligase
MGAVYERFAGLVNPTITRDYYGKSSVWSAGLQMFQESPIRGVGIGSYKLLSPVYGSTMLAYAHNLYVLILTEFGLIGVALFLFLVAAYFSEAIKVLKRLTDKAEKLIFVGLITGLLIYCIQGMTISFSFREADMWAFFGLSIAAIRIFGTQQPATQTETISVTN